MSAQWDDGQVLVEGSSPTFECVPDNNASYGAWAGIVRQLSPFSITATSGGTSVSVSGADDYISCSLPGTKLLYIADYCGYAYSYLYNPEGACGPHCAPREEASVVVPLWPEIVVHEPADIVSGLTDLIFSYEYFQHYNADKRILVYLNNNEKIYDAQGLPSSDTIQATYDFSAKKGFVLLTFTQKCSERAVLFEKLIYVEPEDSCQDKVGKPVSVSSGTVYASETDFSIKGAIPLTFTRYYDSAESAPRDFGVSWSHGYDTRAVQIGSNTYKIINPDGSNVYYIDNNSDKIYDVEFPKGEQSRLIKNTDGSFTRDFFDGSMEEFNKWGTLTAVEESSGTRTTLTRDSGNKLIKIREHYGREINISYNTGNKIKSITVPDGSPGGRVYSYTYLSSGYLGKVTYPDASERNYEYVYVSGIGYRLSGIKDERGNYIEKHTYDAKGRAVTSSSDGKNELLTINYVDNTHTTVTDSSGHVTAYTLDKTLGKSHATDIAGPGCRECGQGNISKSYDNHLNVTSKTDADGNVTEMTYDISGNMLTKTEAVGRAEERTTTYSYNSFGQILTATDHDGDTNEYVYDANGNLIVETDAQGNITTHTYSPDNEKLSTTDKNGNTTTYAYDQYGNIAAITNELDQTISYTFDVTGNRESMTDANGNTTTYEYDLRDRLVKETRPDGGEVIYEYDAAGNKTAVTDAMGNRTTYVYDNINRLIELRRGELPFAPTELITYAYDSENNMTSMITRDSSDSTLTSESYTYDDHNRLLRTTHADGVYTEQSYDALGNVLTKRDENGNITTFTYDALNRLIEVRRGEWPFALTSYTYDSRDNLTSVTDANGNTTIYVYDSLNRLVSTTSPDTGMTSYTYDANGNMLSKTDANGITTTYEYDALNRQTRIQFPDASQNIYYTYDDPQTQNSKGKLTSMTDPSGTTSYDYDKMGRVTMETKQAGNLFHKTGYTYDANGNVSQMTYPGGRNISYTYDQLNKVTSIADTYLGATKTLASNITYLPFGDMASMTQGNGIVTTRAYNNRNQLSGLNAGTLRHLLYSRDNAGNITAITDALAPAKNKTYTYDALGRLTEANGPWGSLEFTYDPTGNRQTETTGSGTTYYHYANNRLISAAGQKVFSFDYDFAGNATSDNGRQYIYSQNQRLARVIDSGAVTGEYTYNGNGQRAKKTVNGQATIFHYDKNGLLIAESTDNGTITSEYVYLNGSPLAKINTAISWSGYNSPDPAYPLHKASLALKVNMASPKTNSLKYYYTRLRLNLISSSITGVSITGNTVTIQGVGTTTKITGRVTETIPGSTFNATLIDGSPDAIGIEIRKPDGTLYYSAPTKEVTSGNYTEEGKNIYYYHNDHLGTPMLMTNSSGQVVWNGEFLPFGEPLSITGTVTNNLRFPGQYYDGETGLHQNWFRDYWAEGGRYLEGDPILLPMAKLSPAGCAKTTVTWHIPALITKPQMMYTYVYAIDNPIIFTDPTGQNIYGNWCGPGGSGPTINGVDSCCKGHDNCYNKSGASWKNSVFGSGSSKTQSCIKDCDKELCSCLKRYIAKNFDELTGKQEVLWWFGCK